MKPLQYLLLLILYIYSPSLSFASNVPRIIHNGKLIYLSNIVLIKYKNSSGLQLNKLSNIESKLNILLKAYNIRSLKKTFSTENNEARKIGLDRIMTIEYSKDIDPLYASVKMRKLPEIEWAEPKYLRRIDFVPNDPSYNSTLQWNLSQIDAQHAWDITQGDTSIIIGIVDTGIDWTHPDLKANMWYGIGYDLGGLNGTPDNNPIEDHPYHGTFVAGVASAVTNNNIGIASIGFNSHLMAVKASRDDMKDGGVPYIYYPDEGIMYAVDHGAKVINCSFGANGYSNAEQDVINYAVAKGALVVAAAGNDNSSGSFYPADYNGVLSVAATSLGDQKASFSNFGYYIDCSAPGDNIYSTWQLDTYLGGQRGTSFAAPLVSGLAALVFARFPNYNPIQVGEQIRVNCDNIDSVNPGFQHLLGYGRINAYKTLSNTSSISVRANDIKFSDNTAGGNNNGNIEPGENIVVLLKLTNYLNPVSNLSISLKSLSGYASVQNGNFNISSIGTMDSSDNYSNPFIIKIADNVPYDDSIALELNYSADNYNDFQFAIVAVNNTFKTQSGNNIALTITSQGNLGFNDINDLQGDGFKFKDGPNLLYEGALMLGTSSVKLSDEALDSNAEGKDTSFQIVSPIKIMRPGNKAAEEGNTIFNDNGSGIDKLGITVDLHSYSFNDDNNKNSIILNYNLMNSNNTDINNFFIGLFFDWDLVEGSGENDYAVYDPTGNLGFVYHLGGNPGTYVGTALISSQNYGFWAINNGDTSAGSIQIYDGFSKDEKWKTLSSGIGNASAGPSDISEVTSAGPFSIPAGNSIDVAFVITAGNNLDELRTNVDNARTAYAKLTDVDRAERAPLKFYLSQNYPNPFNPGTEIDYEIPEEGRVTIKVYDILGNFVKTLVDEEKQPGMYHLKLHAADLASGVYFYQLKIGTYSAAKKIILIK
jgi:serine protease